MKDRDEELKFFRQKNTAYNESAAPRPDDRITRLSAVGCRYLIEIVNCQYISEIISKNL